MKELDGYGISIATIDVHINNIKFFVVKKFIRL